MELKSIMRWPALLISVSILSAVCFAQDVEKKTGPIKDLSEKELRKLDKGKLRPPTVAASFYIQPIVERPGYFSVLLTDPDNRALADSFALSQLEVLEAILVEAKNFAFTEEAVGTNKPSYTRFFDKKEPSFIVDVGKFRDQSQFFLTIKGLTGRITVEVGTIKRSEKESRALLFDILTRVQAAKTSAQQPPQ